MEETPGALPLQLSELEERLRRLEAIVSDQRLRLCDDQGRPVIEITVEVDEGGAYACLRATDKTRSSRTELQLRPQHKCIQIRHCGREIIRFGAGDHGGLIGVSDYAGNPVAEIWTSADLDGSNAGGIYSSRRGTSSSELCASGLFIYENGLSKRRAEIAVYEGNGYLALRGESAIWLSPIRHDDRKGVQLTLDWSGTYLAVKDDSGTWTLNKGA